MFVELYLGIWCNRTKATRGNLTQRSCQVVSVLAASNTPALDAFEVFIGNSRDTVHKARWTPIVKAEKSSGTFSFMGMENIRDQRSCSTSNYLSLSTVRYKAIRKLI